MAFGSRITDASVTFSAFATAFYLVWWPLADRLHARDSHVSSCAGYDSAALALYHAVMTTSVCHTIQVRAGYVFAVRDCATVPPTVLLYLAH